MPRKEEAMPHDDDDNAWDSPQGKWALVVLVVVLAAMVIIGWPSVRSFLAIFD